MEQSAFNLKNFAYFLGEPTATAKIKSIPEDFEVVELSEYDFSAEGEHIWCWVKKTGQNTDWVAKMLAKHFKLPLKAVGYAGKKDRQAVTYQWISLHMPGKQVVDFSKLNIPHVEVLKTVRHHKKLQTGGLKGNQFRITLRGVSGVREEIEARLDAIKQYGFPNYFGEQRFGKDYQNLQQAERLFQNPKKKLPRHLRGLYLSAARSWIFNTVLSERIKAQNWNTYLAGDVYLLANSQSLFKDDGSDAVADRIASFDIHPTGGLTGKGELLSSKEAALIESTVELQFNDWRLSLSTAGMKRERRALRAKAEGLQWAWQDDETLRLQFSLAAGCFATALIRELVVT